MAASRTRTTMAPTLASKRIKPKRCESRWMSRVTPSMTRRLGCLASSIGDPRGARTIALYLAVQRKENGQTKKNSVNAPHSDVRFEAHLRLRLEKNGIQRPGNWTHPEGAR